MFLSKEYDLLDLKLVFYLVVVVVTNVLVVVAVVGSILFVGFGL